MAELNTCVKRKDNKIEVDQLPAKKRGRPFLLGEDLGRQVRTYLTDLRANGSLVNTAIALGVAEGIVKNEDSNLLATNGGHVVLTKHWAKRAANKNGLCKMKKYYHSEGKCS